MASTERHISPDVLRTFIESLLRAHDVSQPQAASVARNIVWSELVDRSNFGVLRLPVYLARLRAGGLNGNCAINIEPLGASMAQVDADNGFGQYAGEQAMSEATRLARETGLSIVGVKNSNFFGTGAYFVNMAAAEGMIGLAMSNSFPKVVAHNGLLPVLGTNPFAFGAPRVNGESVLVDMATSALAGSTVRQYRDAGEKIPDGFAIDREGKSINNPDQVASGALLPFGGAKGYCLSLIVEILAGVITGAGISGGVKSMFNDLSEGGQNGHCMMAFNIGRFMPLETYHQRLEGLAEQLKLSNPGGADVLLPGEVRWKQYRKNLQHGVAMTEKAIDQVEGLAREAGINCPL